MTCGMLRILPSARFVVMVRFHASFNVLECLQGLETCRTAELLDSTVAFMVVAFCRFLIIRAAQLQVHRKILSQAFQQHGTSDSSRCLFRVEAFLLMTDSVLII